MLFNLENKIRIKLKEPPLRFKEFIEEELNFLSIDDTEDHRNLDVIVEFEEGLRQSQCAVIHKAPVG